MNTRENLIHTIEKARVRGVVVPTDLFGKKVFVKTSKHDLVAQIRKEYNETQVTNLRVTVDEENDVVIVESSKARPGTGALPVTLLPESEQPKRPVRSRGRPKGSKNKPKVEAASESSNDDDKKEETKTETNSENVETENTQET